MFWITTKISLEVYFREQQVKYSLERGCGACPNSQVGQEWGIRMNDTFMIISEKCKEADMVLIGLGEEFQYNWDFLIQNKRYQEIENELEKEGDTYRWIIPFLQKMALEKYVDTKLDMAYKNLKEILSDVNYFIISLAMDDYIYRYNFRSDRIVTPCGGFQRMQCDSNCCGKLREVDETLFGKVKSYFDKETSLKELQVLLCDDCGKQMVFNQIGVSKYAEEGYLPQWERYTKWLQGTVNKKACVIELGAGMQFPTIIRWPFEKVVFYNQKAFLYRIHSHLYQLEEKIGERGKGIKENPVNFLANGFVK